jgi:hypothetical protein
MTGLKRFIVSASSFGPICQLLSEKFFFHRKRLEFSGSGFECECVIKKPLACTVKVFTSVINSASMKVDVFL